MLSENFLSKTLNAVSAVALSGIFLSSALTTTSWAMFANEEEVPRTPLQSQKIVVKHHKTLGFVQEIFDQRGAIENFSDEMARELFENLGCTVRISYPGTDWAGNKRGKTMVSFGTGESELKMQMHHGYCRYSITPHMKHYIREYLIRIN